MQTTGENVPMRALSQVMLCGLRHEDGIPDSLAADPQAIDWLFHELHTAEYSSKKLAEFLFRHYPDDSRFRLWKNRAFRPYLGEDGLESEGVYQFVGEHEPNHPWLDSFMEQAAYDFCDLGCGTYFGKDFKSHLRDRFEQRVGIIGAAASQVSNIANVDEDTLKQWVASSRYSVAIKLAAVRELFARNEFDFLFEGDISYNVEQQVMGMLRNKQAYPLLVAAQNILFKGKYNSFAFSILLENCSSESEFVALYERAAELGWHNNGRFIDKVKELGSTLPLSVVRRVIMNDLDCGYRTPDAVRILFSRVSEDPSILDCIKSLIANCTSSDSFFKSLSYLLDIHWDRNWIRDMTLRFKEKNDWCNYDLLARIGDEKCIHEVLQGIGNVLKIEAKSALCAAGRYLYKDPRVKKILIEKARSNCESALQWVALRYSDDPKVQDILEAKLQRPTSTKLIQTLCMQEAMLPHVRERFLESLNNSAKLYSIHCDAILALRHVREELAMETTKHWQQMIDSYQGTFSSVYSMWFSWEPVLDQVIAKIRTGELNHGLRELILQLSDYADISDALHDGIRAVMGNRNSSDMMDVVDAILLLGLIYGNKHETVAFFKEIVERESTTQHYGVETAFAEALRLGSRGEDEFQWALRTLRNTRVLATFGPRILVHFFGRGSNVVDALRIFSLSHDHSALANASMSLLLSEFDEAVPLNTRAALEAMCANEREHFFSDLSTKLPSYLGELVHFTLNDPSAPVRKSALSALHKGVIWYKSLENWSDREFALKCLQRRELTEMAADLLGKWFPEDESVAECIIDAVSRFPHTKLLRQLADSFGNTTVATSFLLENVRKSQKIANSLTVIPRCTCLRCLGFDCEEYAALLIRLHYPPFDQMLEAKVLVANILNDPWIEIGKAYGLIKAVTYGLNHTEKLLHYEKIIRSEAYNRNQTCIALVSESTQDGAALELLENLLNDPNQELRKTIAKTCKSFYFADTKRNQQIHLLLHEIDHLPECQIDLGGLSNTSGSK